MIETVREDDSWSQALPDIDALAAQCAAAAAAVEPVLAGGIALCLCSDAAIQDLNKRFRGKDAPTNVLSFPSGAVDPGRAAGGPDDFLGDIALARETCMAEAARDSLALRDHAAHLIIHGMLHLVGYDHMEERDAAIMEAREIEILQAMGIANPYSEPNSQNEE